MNNSITLVLIDLDGTLLATKRSEVFFACYLFKRGFLKPRQIFSYFLFYFQWTKKFGLSVFKKNKAYLNGLNCNEIEKIGTHFAKNYLQANVRSKIYHALELHRRLDHRLVLLTGTPNFIASPLAEAFNIGNVHATRCAIRNGNFSAEPPLTHPFKSEKLTIAKVLAKELKVDLSKCCIAYADSINDLPLLLSVSIPIVVSPDKQLLHLAKKKKWLIL